MKTKFKAKLFTVLAVLLLTVAPLHTASAAWGDVTEYTLPTPEASPSNLVTGPGGSIWFTEGGANALATINTETGEITEYIVPEAESWPDDLVLGSDGKLWFTSGATNPRSLVSFDTETHQFVTHEISLHGLVADPSGDLWFAAQRTEEGEWVTTINSVDPGTLTVTEKAVLANVQYVNDMTVDADGDVFVTQSGVDQVTRVHAVTGDTTEYTPPSNDANPASITVAPNGDIWFTKGYYNSGKIAKLDLDTSEISEYSLSSEHSWPHGIEVSPTGSVWFADSSFGEQIFMLDPDTSQVTSHTLPTSGSYPSSLLFAEDGFLWITQGSASKLARFDLTPETEPEEPEEPGEPGYTDLAVTNSLLTDGPISPGDTVRYKITVTNIGQETITQNLYPANIYPSWLDFVDADDNISCGPASPGTTEMIMPNHAGDGYGVIGCGFENTVVLAPGDGFSITLNFTANSAPISGRDNHAIVTRGPEAPMFESDSTLYDIYNPNVYNMGVDDLLDEWLNGKLTGWNNMARAVYGVSGENRNLLSSLDGGRPVLLETSEGTNLTCVAVTRESQNSVQDEGYSYPAGLMDFCFNTQNSTNTVSLTFVTDLKPAQVVARKYNATTGRYTNVTGAQIEQTTYNGQPALKVTYTIVDNGELDLDPATGRVRDPIGLAVAASGQGASLASTGQSVTLLYASAAITILGSALVLARQRRH